MCVSILSRTPVPRRIKASRKYCIEVTRGVNTIESSDVLTWVYFDDRMWLVVSIMKCFDLTCNTQPKNGKNEFVVAYETSYQGDPISNMTCIRSKTMSKSCRSTQHSRSKVRLFVKKVSSLSSYIYREKEKTSKPCMIVCVTCSYVHPTTLTRPPRSSGFAP